MEKEKINEVGNFTTRHGGGGYNFELPDPFKPEDADGVSTCLMACGRWCANYTKTRYGFRIPVEEKEVFKKWIKILSGPEFVVNVDYDNILCKITGKWQKLFSDFKVPTNIDEQEMKMRIRITVGGDDINVKRWIDNMEMIEHFLNGNYKIEYKKT